VEARSQGEYPAKQPWRNAFRQSDVNGRPADASYEPTPAQAGWKIETRPQKDCVFRVLATARRDDEVVEAEGQWEQDALDNLQTLLKHRNEHGR
jgi:hypothetical protein